MRATLRTAAGLAALVLLAAMPVRASEAPPAGASAAAPAAIDISAQTKRKKRTSPSSSGQQIACTQLGCHPIPRGCRVVPGRIPFTWDPSGFDDVVCPYPR